MLIYILLGGIDLEMATNFYKSNKTGKIKPKNQNSFFKNKKVLALFLVAIIILGTLIIWRSFASTSDVYEPDSWTISSSQNVRVGSDAAASAGKYIEFLAPSASSQNDYILIKKSELMKKPTSGPGWEFLKKTADSDWGNPSVGDANTLVQTRVLAGALVYARTNDLAYKNKVLAAVKKVCGTENLDLPVLTLARTIFGYVVSADLIGMPLTEKCNNGEAWGDYLKRIKALNFEVNKTWPSLDVTRAKSANNWNTYSLSSHLAISLALKDENAVREDIDIYRRFIGDTSSPAKLFLPTSGYVFNGNGRSLDMLPLVNNMQQVGINPFSINNSPVEDPRSGAIINDAIRVDPTFLPSVSYTQQTCQFLRCEPPIRTGGLNNSGKGYIEEALDGLLATNMMLKAQNQDFTFAQNSALKRAWSFLIRYGGPSSYSEAEFMPIAINKMYNLTGASSFSVKKDSYSRHVGFGDWLF